MAVVGLEEEVLRYVHGENIEVPNSAGSMAPIPPAPEDAVDSHMHIFDQRFPFAEGRSPDFGAVEQYRQFQRRMGLRKNVVVSPSSYGFDNSCLVDALDQFGDDARGVAGVRTGVSDDELKRLDEHGVRGIRLNFGRVAGTTIDDVVSLTGRIQPLGWHLQLHMDANGIVANEAVLAGLPGILVIDHFGGAPQPGGEKHAVVDVLKRLLDRGRTYVKLARFHESGDVKYADHAPSQSC